MSNHYRNPLAQANTTIRALIVEDDADTRRSLEALVEAWGHITASVTTGEECLNVINEFIPSHVLIDIGLPDMDGYQLAQALRAAHGERFRLIALTGYEGSEVQTAAFSSGFDVYLAKPVNVSRLKASLQGQGF
jgi:CheY-like chemotaxis protein